MKKLLAIVVLGLLYSCSQVQVKDLKKETFNCSGKGGTGKIVQASFAIDPSSKTLTFIQGGGLMGSMLNYPSKIKYNIKSSSGDEILTQDNTYSTINRFGRTMNFISYIETYDKKKFYYGFRGSKYKSDPYVFKNCSKS